MYNDSKSSKAILKEIYHTYILGIPLIRYTFFPTMFCMLIARYLEVILGEMMQKVATKLNFEFDNSCSSLVGRYFIISIISCLLIELQGFIFTGSIQRAYRTAACKAFKQFMDLEYLEFKKYGMGEIHATIERKSLAVSEIMDVLILNLLPVVFVIFFSTYKIYKILGFITTLILYISLVAYTVTTIEMAKWRNTIRREYNKKVNKVSNQLYDSFNNYDIVKAFNNEFEEVSKYDYYLKEVEISSTKLWRTFYLLNFLQRLIFGLQTCFIIYIGVKGIMREKFTPDQLVLYLSISRILSSNLDKLGYMYGRFTQAMTNAKMSFINLSSPKKLYPIRSFNRDIVFKNVGFSYNKRNISNNINFYIEKYDKVAIIGSNGIGKSTLLKSLLKFTHYNGNIKIDGDEVKYISNDSLRTLISYIPQDSLLFDETVEYNLKYGSDITNMELTQICKEYDIHDSINRLDSGYNTTIGTRGSNLSGGEKQKISFVRALLKESEILLLDEPTANLDKVSENNLIKRILQKEKHKTIIMVIHSLSLLKHFNKIFYLDPNNTRSVTEEEAIDLMNNKL
ncbi:ABC-transporter [Spraguea lophii 42_110]|uniref:ABC-transporter n=1 Tax=Spraguea lophii (strain 42_110) TaxID=1358809 RepID=S7WC21_SPRLO|nr:ABC-transporter [Spraguea lophii 42_110]